MKLYVYTQKDNFKVIIKDNEELLQADFLLLHNDRIELFFLTCGKRAGHKHLYKVNNRNRNPSKFFPRAATLLIKWLRTEFEGATLVTEASDYRRSKIYVKGLKRLGLKPKAEALYKAKHKTWISLELTKQN